MCTVTFFPQHDNGFILTSNRDEAPERNTFAPQKYEVNGTALLFPKDEVAGGTWIGLSEKKRLICLLNGGFDAHKRASEYRMSRGVIVTDLLTREPISEVIEQYNFIGIEPFTIILVLFEKNTQLFELVWDGTKAHFTEKSLQPHIWSSSLLYTPEVKKLRETWFATFVFDTMTPSAEEILEFHHKAGTGNPEQDLIMNRNFVKTKSITQVQKNSDAVHMNYEDLSSNQQTQTSF